MTDRASYPLVGVVILHWHSGGVTMEAVQSALLSEMVRVKVYLVDHGASEAERAAWKNLQQVTVLGDGINRGFPAGANLGAKQALADGADYVLFLNSDATVRPKTISGLIAAGGGAVNPRVLDKAGKVWFDAGMLTVRGRGVSRRAGPDKVPQTVSFVHACILLVQKETIAAIGFFDEALFAYGEDVDFSVRAAARGVSLKMDATVTGIHRQSVSVLRVAGKQFRDYYVIRNMILILRKHRRGGWIGILALVFPELLFPAAYFLCTVQTARVRALFRGFRDGLKGISGESGLYPGRSAV